MLANEICTLSSNIALSKDITIQNTIASDIYVSCDIEITKTIFRNLISNAIKFTNSKGIVSISAKRKDNFIVILIKDTGVGMSDDTISNLFKIDKQVSTIGTADEQGTGLGLLLCKELIEKQGGKIWLESEVNKGSSFYFMLTSFKE